MADETPSARLDALAAQRNAALSFRDRLRDARSEVLADAEGFMAVVIAVESLGHWLNAGGHGLGDYAGLLVALVSRTGVAEPDAFSRDICVLRESRNDTAHGGVAARHVADEALRVSVALEGALTVLHPARWAGVTAREVMTANPTVAWTWQQVGEVRRVMLTRGFTALPYRTSDEQPWRLLTDDELARWLNRAPLSSTQRSKRLGMELRHAVAAGLRVLEAERVPPEATVEVVAALSGLRFVVESDAAGERLLGVIAPSDLL